MPARRRLLSLAAAALLTLLLYLFFVCTRLGRLDAIDLGQAYAGATVAIAGSGFLLMGVLLVALRPVDLGQPVNVGVATTGVGTGAPGASGSS